MNTNLLDGRVASQAIRQQVKEEAAIMKAATGHVPGLAVILVGNDPASQVYVNNKRKACQDVGFLSKIFDLPTNTQQNTLLSLIDDLNLAPNIHGILVQLPLPDPIDSNLVLERIHPKKDVDGFHPYNLGRLAQRRPLLRPCTPHGIMRLLAYYAIDVKGKHSVVVGASNIVGRPLTLELLLAGSTTTTCHRFTKNLSAHVAQADLLVVATGKRGLIDPEHLKPGVIIVDVGMHRLNHGKLCGDIDFDACKAKASWITPVPGGVGPMTITTLLENTLYASKDLC